MDEMPPLDFSPGSVLHRCRSMLVWGVLIVGLYTIVCVIATLALNIFIEVIAGTSDLIHWPSDGPESGVFYVAITVPWFLIAVAHGVHHYRERIQHAGIIRSLLIIGASALLLGYFTSVTGYLIGLGLGIIISAGLFLLRK
jgi:hypothetical protein